MELYDKQPNTSSLMWDDRAYSTPPTWSMTKATNGEIFIVAKNAIKNVLLMATIIFSVGAIAAVAILFFLPFSAKILWFSVGCLAIMLITSLLVVFIYFRNFWKEKNSPQKYYASNKMEAYYYLATISLYPREAISSSCFSLIILRFFMNAKSSTRSPSMPR